MSYEEKRAWIYAAIAVGLPVVYFATVLGQVGSVADVDQIAYVRPLLWAIGAAIVLNIVLSIVATIASPEDRDRTDERDTSINRYGEYVAGIVLGAGMVVPFALTLAQAPHFWIAQGMYLAFVLSALTSAVIKIRAYRRGL
ncbi:hypothetical protein [Pengzhenrongella frigida]|uniref:DUF2178 domain-containing protein n=1 Tax=Pengzhenrongella frigida TaxID=1259133 RepID=A0A4Q5N086_9MICO|nr:hypothetical protein [Cellulomonas sp. HLT2-17]RYV50623.1 hypothetical protein EUA98_12835 [Cellulomonas sp. HLT2-17]